MGHEVDAWSDFFVATAGATAALTGLVFVAVSINLDRILGLPGLPDRALATLVLLITPLLVSVLALAPGQADGAVGAEIAMAGALAVGATGVLVSRVRASGQIDVTAHAIAVATLVFLGTAPFVVGGISLMEGTGGGLYWVLGGTVAALAGGVANAWVLLVEIVR